MKKILCLALLLLLGSVATQAQTKTKKKKKTTTETATTNTTTSNSSDRLIAPKLTLNFISKGAGIDNDVYQKVEAFANNHPKKPAFTLENYGREGERKMRFMLTELTPDEQVAFVQEVDNIIGKSDRVHMHTTVPMKKKNTTIKGPGIDVAPTATAVPAETKYRLVVSFISKGQGINKADFDKIRAYIEDSPKAPDYEMKRWGREGERDLLLQLDKLNPDDQKVFIDELKKLITSGDMVQVRENEVYVKKGR